MMLSHDLLRELISLLDDPLTFYNIALTCRATSKVCNAVKHIAWLSIRHCDVSSYQSTRWFTLPDGSRQGPHLDVQPGYVSFSMYYFDKQEGLHYQWFINTGSYLRRVFVNGKRNGPATGWYVNGSRWFEAVWCEDRLHGVYIEWDPDGTVIVRRLWEHGTLIPLSAI